MSPAVLAVDAGQTEIRATLVDGGRRAQTCATAPGVLRMGPGVGPEEVGAGVLAAVAALGGLPDPCPPLAVGLSGFEAAGDEDLRRVAELLRGELAVERLAIASDGLTSLLGALAERDGAVVAAGTGAVCVARRGGASPRSTAGARSSVTPAAALPSGARASTPACGRGRARRGLREGALLRAAEQPLWRVAGAH